VSALVLLVAEALAAALGDHGQFMNREVIPVYECVRWVGPYDLVVADVDGELVFAMAEPGSYCG